MDRNFVDEYLFSLEKVFPIAVVILLCFGICSFIVSLVKYLFLIWEEKHNPRRMSVTYDDILQIMYSEICCIPYDHILFGEYRSAIESLEQIVSYYKREYEGGKLPKIVEKHIYPAFYEDILHGRKTFEIRKDKDDIQTGDILILREIAFTEFESKKETGRVLYLRVKGVLRHGEDFGLKRGYCIISV